MFISAVITLSSNQHHYFSLLLIGEPVCTLSLYIQFFHDSHHGRFKKHKSHSSYTYLKFSSGFPNSEGDFNSLP